VFDACQRLLELDAEFTVALRAEFFSYARAQMRERKEAQNIFSYDDLLTRLDEALAGPGGAELAEAIRAKYQAALIDEFQDTDPGAVFDLLSHLLGAARAGRVHRRSEAGRSTASAARMFLPTCRRPPRRNGSLRSRPTGARKATR
jgi:superfamily I DNA/RNA helicase